MRLSFLLACSCLVACSNDVDPRVIAGGGVGDGEIDGEINVAVIDSATDKVISGATVDVGGKQKTTDAKGFVTFSDVEGQQTVAVKMSGYRSSVWVDVNGANVTIGLQPNTTAVPQATLSGSITGWDTISVPAGHAKAAAVFTSQTTTLGDKANDVPAGNMNFCITQNACNWTVNSRTGTLTLVAVIFDRDLHGTLADPTDDTNTILGWAFAQNVVVNAGVDQSGLALAVVEAGNLQNVSVDNGSPPASLTSITPLVGIEVSKDEVIQVPLAIVNIGTQVTTVPTSILFPKPTVFAGTATYRLTIIAQTASGGMGAQAAVIRTGLAGPSLAAGTWLQPPTGVTATRTSGSWDLVTGARAQSMNWRDMTGAELLDITTFNTKRKQVDVPTLVALPTSGTLTAHGNAIGADLDPNDFSLDEDSDKIWGFAVQPVNVP